ncbi:MAG: DUF222 domain-containing protein [Acidimicrobiales bacterium]
MIPLERLEDNITQLSGHIAAASAQLLRWISDYDRREGWRSWGCKSAAHWLSWKCGDDLHTAREKVRTARALDDLPAISAAFAAGELSYSKVRAITRVALPEDDAEWVDRAKHSTGGQLERTVAAVKAALDRDENADAASAFARRNVKRSRREDALDMLTTVGPADLVETIWAALDVVASQMLDDAIAGTDQTRHSAQVERGGIGAVRFDALVRIAEQVLAANPVAAHRGDVGRLTLVVDTDGLQELADSEGTQADGSGGEVTLSGKRVAPEVAKRWACDISSSVMLEAGGHVHDEGRQTKLPNRRLRRAVHRRDDGTCRFPGCGATTWLHTHHIVHWANGGPTDLDNLISLCGFHHHLVHEGGWSVSLDGGQVRWATPDGTELAIEPLGGSVQGVLDVAPPGRITSQSIQSLWANDRLDFGFVVAVLTEHCLATREARKRPRGDAFSPSRSPGSAVV